MRSRGVLAAACMLAALSAVACGTEDDSPSDSSAGTGGKNSAGTGGKNSSGAGGGTAGGVTAGGGGDIGQGGEGGVGPGNDCVQLSTFVHAVIKDDTTAKAVPRPVNDIVFCADPANPAAYNDLF